MSRSCLFTKIRISRPSHFEGLCHVVYRAFRRPSSPSLCWNTDGSIKEHYRDVAETYDSFMTVMKLNHLPVVQEGLQLKPDDVLVDIGGGTGWYAHRLWKAAGLKEPVVCVDPSAEMLEVAKRKEGVTAVQATAEEFFSRPQERLFTKAMTSGSFHHFSDPGAVLKGVWNSLRPGGSYVVLTYAPTRPDDADLPFFRAALAIHSTFDFISQDRLSSLIEASAPFKVQTKVVKVEYGIPKAQWYRMIRGRYLSKLRLLASEEIENGIAELERETFGALQDDDLITKIDTIIMAVAYKDQ